MKVIKMIKAYYSLPGDTPIKPVNAANHNADDDYKHLTKHNYFKLKFKL